MADEFTTCLASDVANVIAILTAAPFNHKWVATYAPLANGVHTNRYPYSSTNPEPGRTGSVAGIAAVVHTISPPV